MAKLKHPLTDQARRILRDTYDSRTETIDQLVVTLQVPRHTVKRWARQLGLARTKPRRWTPEEDAYLDQNLSRRSVERMALHLRRTVTAVALRAKRLRITKSDEGYTSESLALALGVDGHKVRRWIAGGVLRATRRHTRRENDTYYISDNAVRDFVVDYPGEINLRMVDSLWFIDLLGEPWKRRRANQRKKEASDDSSRPDL